MNKFLTPLIVFTLLSVLSSTPQCKKGEDLPADKEPEAQQKVEARFTLMPPEITGIKYSNLIKEDYNYNIFTYEYLQNGCGVAVGDVNGDMLPDLYFATAFGPNRLFINVGNFGFLDVTKAAGVAAIDGFKTGVTMADVNGDGKLDIYVCRTSKTDDGKKTNHLFINMGNKSVRGIPAPYFEDQAVKLGLDDNSDSNHASFFDFDRDGDLDLFILNHRIGFPEAAKLRLQQNADGSTSRITSPQTPYESNRFYRNDNGHFVDITAKAGLLNSAFGLSATPVDINKDGWMDIYVGNDFVEPDYIYINNKNGTFTDHYNEFFRHGCQNCMGSDVADINNDGLDDVIVLDMKAQDPIRYKMLANPMQYDRYNLLIQYGYGRQNGRNMLQLNTGNNTFIEIGQYAGVAATDWSWAPLMADFDNDGWKDIYITNGYRRDISDLDYTNFFQDSIRRTGGVSQARFPDINDVLKHIPENPQSNYLLINNRQLGFVDATAQAGINIPSYSNGMAYADLDLDGDLDLIVHNLEDPVFILRNDITNRNWLQITPQVTPGNTITIGTKAEVFAGKHYQYQTLMTTKGFLSSSEPLLHFGLGEINQIDSVILTWPLGGKEIMRNVPVNKRIAWKKGDGSDYSEKPATAPAPLFTAMPAGINWVHRDNDFVDFKREKLIPYMLSAEGPCMAVGDINGDKLDDIYAGNGAGFPSVLLTQNINGTFTSMASAALQQDAGFEDCGSVLEDIDGDGDNDLVVISGGNDKPDMAAEYKPRVYLNDGKGGLTRVSDFPDIRTNAGAILSVDIDRDKDKDLIIGGKCVPGAFPTSPKSYLLINNQGRFTDATAEMFPALDNLGMISDMEAADLDGDGIQEIVLVGEWLPVTVFAFDGKKYVDKTASYGLDKTSGWWKSVSIADIDGDGDMDILAGNIGLNHRMRTSESEPVTLVTKDFDGNGSLDPIMCYYYQHKLYPFAGRDAIIAQIPRLKKKYLRYKDYASATISDIFTEEELSGSSFLYTNTFETALYRNDKKKFVRVGLPYQVQFHPVYDMLVYDFNRDGRLDLLLAGNFLYSEVETSEMDAGNGTLLLQNEDGTFTFVNNREHGFWAKKEVRELELIHTAGGKEAVVTGNNRGPLEISLIAN